MMDDLENEILNKRMRNPLPPVEKIVDDEGKFKEYYCPTCGRNIGLLDRCKKRSQLIDWGF